MVYIVSRSLRIPKNEKFIVQRIWSVYVKLRAVGTLLEITLLFIFLEGIEALKNKGERHSAYLNKACAEVFIAGKLLSLLLSGRPSTVKEMQRNERNAWLYSFPCATLVSHGARSAYI